MFGVLNLKYRPLPIKDCPSIIKDLLKSGLDENPNKRPSMKLILNIMEKLNSLINKTPILPITQNTSESKSIRNDPIPHDYGFQKSEKELIKEELNNYIKFMLYDPIEPNKLSNRSNEIYKNHKKLIDDNKLLQKKIDSTKQQSEQLNSKLEKGRLQNELKKQKQMILKEKDKLRYILENQNKDT